MLVWSAGGDLHDGRNESLGLSDDLEVMRSGLPTSKQIVRPSVTLFPSHTDQSRRNRQAPVALIRNRKE